MAFKAVCTRPRGRSDLSVIHLFLKYKAARKRVKPVTTVSTSVMETQLALRVKIETEVGRGLKEGRMLRH